jgi:K(+)-stimulated pyrophosphate-energized sodium pump
MESIIVALAAGGVALVFAAITAFRVLRADPGNQRMRQIGDAIREGSSAFLRREYLVLFPFVIVVAGILWVLIDWWTLDDLVPKTAISYLAGTVCSAR